MASEDPDDETLNVGEPRTKWVPVPRGPHTVKVYLDSDEMLSAREVAHSRGQALAEYLTQACKDRIDADSQRRTAVKTFSEPWKKLWRDLLGYSR